MTCAEFRELAALYALGALSPEERAAAEAHLAEPSHEGCFESLRRASAGTEVLARSLVPAKPDERVWRAIEAQVRRTAVSPPAAVRWRERAAWVIAAAALVLLAAGLGVRQELLRNEAQLGSAKDQCLRDLSASRIEGEQLRAVVTLLLSPSSKVVAFAPQPGQQAFAARAVVDLAQRKAMLLSASLPRQPGKDFQLWVLRGGVPQPAGLLRGDASGTVLASIDPALLANSFEALAVSLEPQGGSPDGKPSSVILVGPLS